MLSTTPALLGHSQTVRRLAIPGPEIGRIHPFSVGLFVTSEILEGNAGDPGVHFAGRRQVWRRIHGVPCGWSPVTPGPEYILRGHCYPGDVILGELIGVGRG